jgi:hypothetical protein
LTREVFDMATTCFFKEIVVDKEDKSNVFDLGLGRSSFYDEEDLVYLRVGDHNVIMDAQQGKRFCQKVKEFDVYLSYIKP